jgi:hypothetical protein
MGDVLSLSRKASTYLYTMIDAGCPRYIRNTVFQNVCNTENGDSGPKKKI